MKQVECWILIRKNGEDPRLMKLGPKYVKVECTRAIIVLPEEDLKNAPKSVMYWFAYTTAKINPFLTQTVEEIFSQPVLTKKVCNTETVLPLFFFFMLFLPVKHSCLLQFSNV